MSRAALAIVALISLGACNRPYLTWTPREPLSARRGKVAILVEDAREGDPRSLGRAFGWGGVAREIEQPPDHVRNRLWDLTREAVVTAGLGLGAPAEPPTSRLALTIAQLRCDGTGLRAEATLSVRWSVSAPDGAPRLAGQTFEARGKASGCEGALAAALDDLLDELAAKLVEGPGHDAALGEGAVSPS